MAGLVGIEPTLRVLETRVLPLYDSPKRQSPAILANLREFQTDFLKRTDGAKAGSDFPRYFQKYRAASKTC